MEKESSKLDVTLSSEQATAAAKLIDDHVTISSPESANVPTRSMKTSQLRIIENFIVLWLDPDIDRINSDYQHSIIQLRAIVNSIDTFTSTDECADFLTKIQDEKAFLIVSGALCQHFVPLIHDCRQLNSIYVLCDNRSQHEQWAKDYSKIKDVFTQIKPICDLLKRETHQWDHDLQPSSIVSSNRDLNELDPSFMYSQLLKEILRKMNYDERAKNELVDLFRELFIDNRSRLKIVDEFERDYHLHSPIWWYTRDCFVHYMLNRALRTLEIDIVIKMGFFLRDLHQQIEQLYNETPDARAPFIVYRGQGLFNSEFEKICNSEGGLLSFNSFLSTSTDRQVSFLYAESARENQDLTGILFRIQINPTLTSAPYAGLNDISYFNSEEEILFSMHTVFRIGDIKQIADRLWQVELTLTNDDDEQLRALKEHMRAEIGKGNGWNQLGHLMINFGAFDKAEEIYQTLLKSPSSHGNKEQLASIYNQLGSINNQKADHKEALSFYQKALEIEETSLPSNHPSLTVTYNNIGSVYDSIKEYSTALEFYQKALKIQQKCLPSNHLSLATTYTNIGSVHHMRGEYGGALEFYRKALEIKQGSLHSHHPGLAAAYVNIGQVHDLMGEYSTALDFYQKTLEIKQKSLHPNHPDLIDLYGIIGLPCIKVKKYSTTLESYQMLLEICQKSFPPKHSLLAATYSYIAGVHELMGEYSTALEFYQKTFEIEQNFLLPNHPSLAVTYSNIGRVHDHMEKYWTALSFYQKAVEMQQNSQLLNDSDLAITYKCIGFMIERWESTRLHSSSIKRRWKFNKNVSL